MTDIGMLNERFIPAFEKAHGSAYQALVMVDNFQGHSAYAEDALLASRMNMQSKLDFEMDGICVVEH
ncbi:hypothetical protein AX16_004792 [Volvariella volvacea WC 439]|nr:hypothetical protein AX16_004792 [Volvariella volvacea WC 439]